ncbi:MAG: hypothetical protein IJP16_04135 [Clostridia bacterium]|nr:hypothetical protein [Clostridia bacterium]
MENLIFDLSQSFGKFKILNATNGGPWHKRHANDQYRSNFKEYKAARIPYSRNHDSAAIGIYGGPYSHDITRIFPDFSADENDPASYDFACTDESILTALDAGTETFFRLGQTIEHQIKKHGTLPPADFHKWARICEHIIRHYNEGWADGYHLNIEYWEIWNEPDLDTDDSKNKRTWGGVRAEFFDLYEIAAKHLKSCFPHLKIGGPALAGWLEWAEAFLCEMQKRCVPIDFFSWHIYCTEPKKMLNLADKVNELLVKYGYGDVESILNEWNYVKGWTDEFVYTIESIHGLKGAAFVMSCICEAQKSDHIDMLMYYDTRPSAFCGAFDFYTYRTLKGYYPLMWYGKFYDMEYEVRCKNQPEGIYTLCGVDKDGKVLCIVVNYSDNDDSPSRELSLDFGKSGSFELYLVDDNHDGELIDTTEELAITLPRQSFMLIKEV